jgi:outer membrane protein OmpA-like peptidoglycan-associated protein
VDDRKVIVATSLFSAVLVLGVVVPLGYFSQQALDQKLADGQDAFKGVIIDLKTETLKEIKNTAAATDKSLANNSPQTDPAIVASIEALKTQLDQLQVDQKQLFEKSQVRSDTIVSEVKSAIVSDVKGAIAGLKSQTLMDIKNAADQAGKEIAKNSTQTDPAVAAELGQLKSGFGDLKTGFGELKIYLDELRDGQKQLFEKLKRPPVVVASASPPPPPGSREDTLNQTVYFPLGTVDGPVIDQQIATMTPNITNYSKSEKCHSNVMGFSDTLGGDKSNLKLSEKRAQHVATLLRQNQISVGDVKGWGERWLKVHTVDGIKNEKNRRVVIETVCDGKIIKTAGSVS